MITAGVITGVAVIDSGVTLHARIRGNSGALITQASVSTITYNVRDLTAGETVTTGQSLTVSSVVFDSLQQTDPRWDVDDQYNVGKDGSYGYNFLATLPPTHFANYDVGEEFPYEVKEHEFLVSVEFVPASGNTFRQVWKLKGIVSYP